MYPLSDYLEVWKFPLKTYWSLCCIHNSNKIRMSQDWFIAILNYMCKASVSIMAFATLLPPCSLFLQHFATTVHLYRRGIAPLYQGLY